MTNLLHADFKRIFKDKLLLIMGILALVFALFNPLLYAVIFSSTEMIADEMTMQMLSGYVSAKGQFFGSFSIGNNLGLIAPVLLAIALCKDFSFGTVRNKVIAGKSRTHIFASLFITCATVIIGVMLLHGFVTLGVSLIFFDYQATAFTVADFWYFMASLGMELLVLLYVAALLSWLCASMKNVGLVIVLYIAIALLTVMAGSITQMVLGVLELLGGKEKTIALLRFFDRINVGNAASYIGKGTSYSLEDVLYIVIPPLTGILAFLGLGCWKFNKKDLK